MSSLIIMVAVLLMCVFSVVILLAASRSGRLPLRVGEAASAAGKDWRPVGRSQRENVVYSYPPIAPLVSPQLYQ